MTALFLILPFPILIMAALSNRVPEKRMARLFRLTAWILAVWGEIPLLVWVHRSVVDESAALYLAYFGALVFLYFQYWVAQLIVGWGIKRLSRPTPSVRL